MEDFQKCLAQQKDTRQLNLKSDAASIDKGGGYNN
jgi:hypothetical protein